MHTYLHYKISGMYFIHSLSTLKGIIKMVFLTEQELNYVYQENLKYLLSCIHAFYFHPNVNRNKAKAETFKALSRVNKNRQALFLKPLTFNDIKVYETSAFIKF